jgi:hypothetical protein
MDTLPGTQFTDMWMQNPWGTFDPTQKSNQFSNFNNAALPWPPSYAGAPTNAATGQPIQSYQNWQQQNPGGMTMNNTPAQPQAPPQNAMTPAMAQQLGAPGLALASAMGAPGVTPQTPYGQPGTNTAAIWNAAGATPQQMAGLFGQMSPTIPGTNQPNPNYSARIGQLMAGAGQQPQQQAAPQASGPPNNWQAALSALANPGNPVTPGATVPQSNSFQPAGGVNQAFLQNAAQNPAARGGNPQFMSALAAVQNRPQQQW